MRRRRLPRSTGSVLPASLFCVPAAGRDTGAPSTNFHDTAVSLNASSPSRLGPPAPRGCLSLVTPVAGARGARAGTCVVKTADPRGLLAPRAVLPGAAGVPRCPRGSVRRAGHGRLCQASAASRPPCRVGPGTLNPSDTEFSEQGCHDAVRAAAPRPPPPWLGGVTARRRHPQAPLSRRPWTHTAFEWEPREVASPSLPPQLVLAGRGRRASQTQSDAARDGVGAGPSRCH